MVQVQKCPRSSNLELLRIVCMLMIIAHHYVVHSGVIDVYDLRNFGHEISGNRVFLELWGWGGKTGINCFLLITGFFMCKLDFTWKKITQAIFADKVLHAIIAFCLLGLWWTTIVF